MKIKSVLFLVFAIFILSSFVYFFKNSKGSNRYDLEAFLLAEKPVNLIQTVSYDWLDYYERSKKGNPIITDFYQDVALNLAEGSILGMGFLSEVILKINNEYYYIESSEKKISYCQTKIVDDYKAILLVYDGSLKFSFDQNLTNEQKQHCNEVYFVKNIAVNK